MNYPKDTIRYSQTPPVDAPRISVDPEIVHCVTNGTIYRWNRTLKLWTSETVAEEDTNFLIPFNDQIPFDKAFQYMQISAVNGPIEFSVDNANRIPGAVTLVRVLSDGVNEPTFSGITEITSSTGYDNRENILNHLCFFHDGVRYMVNIFQDKNAVASDIVSPQLNTLVVANSVRDRIVLTFNESLDVGSVPDESDFTVSNHVVNNVTVQGNTVHVFVSSLFTYQEAITVSYLPGANPIQDTTGNHVDAISSQAVTNNIAAPDAVAPVLQTATVENANPNKIILTYNEDLLTSPLPATSDFSVSGGKTVSSVSIVGPVVTLTVDSNYSAGNTITVSYTGGTNKIKDLSGNLAANLSSQAVTNNVAATAQIVAWENLVNATDSGGFINYQSSVSGGRGTVSIDPAVNFEVYAQLTSLCPATVLMLDKDSANAYVWGGTQSFEAGVYYFGSGANYATNGTSYTEFDAAFALPTFVKLRKSGNDIILSRCATENGSYTDVHTFTGALVGLSVLYIHVLFAANSAGDKIQVKYKIG